MFLDSQRTMTYSKLSSYIRHFSTSFHHLIRGTGKSTKDCCFISDCPRLGKNCFRSLNNYNSYLMTITDKTCPCSTYYFSLAPLPFPQGALFRPVTFRHDTHMRNGGWNGCRSIIVYYPLQPSFLGPHVPDI